MNSARRHASRSLLWSSVDTFGQTGFALIALALLARLLSVEQIGIGSLAVMLVQLAGMSFELLFHDALIQRSDLQERHHATAFTTSVLGAACGAALMVLAAPWIAAQYDKPQLADLLRVAAIAMPIAAASSTISAVLRRNLSFAPLARRTLVGRLAGVGLGIAVAWSGGGAWALVAMYVASLVLSTLVLVTDRSNLPKLQWSYTALRELLKFAAPNMLSQLLLLGNGRFFVAVAGFYLSDVALGRFTLAFRAVEELRNTLSSAASQLALPLLAKRAQRTAEFAAVFAEATSFTACILLPLYAGMAVTAHDLIGVVFGAKWQEATMAVQLLAVAAMLVTLRQYSSIAINAVGRPGLNLKVNGLIFITSLLMLASGFVTSADAAATAWVLRALLLLVASVLATRWATQLSSGTQLAPLVAPLCASLLMCVAVVLLQHIVTNMYADAFRLSISIAVGATVYVLSLFALSPQLFKHLVAFACAALRRQSAVAG